MDLIYVKYNKSEISDSLKKVINIQIQFLLYLNFVFYLLLCVCVYGHFIVIC